MNTKSWTEKLTCEKPHVVKRLQIDFAGMKAGAKMLVPTARMVDGFIRAIPRGKAIDVPKLRDRMARKHEADVTCPVTTGFHLRTVAEAALEAHQRGTALAKVTPFWRVLDGNTPTTRKLSCGVAFVAKQRKAEGIAEVD